MNDPVTIHFLDTDHGTRLAWTGREVFGKPTIIFFAGHGSDMDGTKAIAVDSWAEHNGFGMIRFDYSGHGQSSGAFLDGTIGQWKKDCLAIIDTLTSEAVIIVGSSLGGWLMLNVALARPARIAGLIGIAAAPDFTAELIWDSLDKTQQTQMQDTGQIALPNHYSDDPVVYPMALVTDGKAHLHLQAPVNITAPVHLLHGMQDDEVPWQTATRLAEKLASENVQVSLVRNAGHRFSEPDQIALLGDALDGMLAKLS